MTNFIPIFPLNIVAYPTEVLNLHIFEPRYKQLITECVQEDKPFGLPVVINNSIQEVGILMQIKSIVTTYDTGAMDIKALGINTFIILDIIKEVPNKLYSGAIVTYFNYKEKSNAAVQVKVVQELKKMHHLLGINKDYKKQDAMLTSYDVAHHIGLSLLQEYELLCLENEAQRLQFLLNHLAQAVLTLDEKEKAISRIKLNGQFRNLSLDDFDIKFGPK